jgi:glutamyl-tRNA reductase
MLDGYHLLTLTHRQAALESIGQTIIRDDEPAAVLQHLKARFGWEELLYLPTCNRVVYLFYSRRPQSDQLAGEVLAALRPDLPADTINDLALKMRLLRGADAIRHLLEVAASMDSLVVGEREIIRQLREAFDRCRDWGLTGDHLRLLLRFTVETAKEVYTATGIGEKALSVVALAFQQMLKTGLHPSARILLIGAGQTNTLVAKFLFKYGFQNVTVFNRTLAKAQAIAEYLEGSALPLSALEHYTGGFDAIIVCTGATEPVITPALYHKLLAAESNSKVIVDLSVPNNVDARIPRTFPVQYIEIEGLREVARENLAYREEERKKAEALITVKVRAYREQWHQRQVERALLPMVDDVRIAKERAITEIFAKELAQLDPAAQDVALRMLDYLEKKSVATAMRTMKEIAERAGRQVTAGAEKVKA